MTAVERACSACSALDIRYAKVVVFDESQQDLSSMISHISKKRGKGCVDQDTGTKEVVKISKTPTNLDRASVERKIQCVKGSIVGAFERDWYRRQGRGSWSWSGLGKGREEGNGGRDGKDLHLEDSDRFDEAG